MNADQLCMQMEKILFACPEYESPGTTDLRMILSCAGCDCSGAIVAAFSAYGEKLYHGSNTIARKYLRTREKLTSVKQLRLGMAVFKWSESGAEPQKYHSDGLGDFHHIGVVCGLNPLRIIHQSSAAGCTTVDNSIKKWAYCGEFKAVDYETEQTESTDIVEAIGGDSMYKIKVVTASLRIRKQPNTNCDILGSLPRDTIVNCSELSRGWYKLADSDGWISGEYCLVLEQTGEAPSEEVDEDEPQIMPDFAQMIAEIRSEINDLKQLVDVNTSIMAQISRDVQQMKVDLHLIDDVTEDE